MAWQDSSSDRSLVKIYASSDFLNQVYYLLVLDEDECQLNTYICPDLSTCSNTIGSYDCICHTGYEKSGSECVGMCQDSCQFTFRSLLIVISGAQMKFISLFENLYKRQSESPVLIARYPKKPRNWKITSHWKIASF